MIDLNVKTSAEMPTFFYLSDLMVQDAAKGCALLTPALCYGFMP